jgi:serine/threonine-protein kinase
MASAVFLALIVGAGVTIQAKAGRLSGDPDEFAAESGAPVVPERAGSLLVVADPWAEVYVDGQHVATTPTARPISLPPGRHFLKLSNPYFQHVDREIRVRPGELSRLEIELLPLTEVDGGVDDEDEPNAGGMR